MMANKNKPVPEEELAFQRYQFAHLEGILDFPGWQQRRDKNTGRRVIERLLVKSDTPLKRNRRGVDAE